MSGYLVYQPPETDDPAHSKIIAEGFSWLGLGSPTFWALRNGLWELVIANIIVASVLAALATPAVAAVILLIWRSIFGFMAGHIHAQFLEWRAYRFMRHIPNARHEDAAFVEWIYTR